ncbi:hypothetical protein M9Y10_013404 [Tritrichomonas musculus]|uniref:Importin N-terminal domain-containing protein n=1 Tax=Tritrichomonas musculus TaxID=1915356 RepID=A0ABR2I8G4_9EUKA
MDESTYQLILRASSTSDQDQIYSELQNLIENQNSIFELINILETQNTNINIQFICLILIRQIISNIFTNSSQSNYLFLLKVSEEIQQKLTRIFYSPPEASVLIPQFASLCCNLKYCLDSFYSFLKTALQNENLQLPNFYSNIQSILTEIIQDEQIYQNSFKIALEFLSYSNEKKVESILNNDFCQFIYPFLFDSKSSSEAIQILNLMHDYSVVPVLLENIEKIDQNDTIVQFIKLLNSFYSSIFSNEELFLNGLRSFNFVYEFLLKLINESEDENVCFESILFFLNLFISIVRSMNSFSLNLNQIILTHLNDFILCLFEKVGIDKNIEFYGISTISLKTILLISIIFPQETFSIIFSKFESTFSNALNFDSFHVQCSLRIFTKILSKKNNFLMNSSSLFDVLKFAFNASMNFIPFSELAVDSSYLFSKSLKIIVIIQNIRRVQEIDVNSIGCSGFERILHAYSIFDFEIKKKLSKVIWSLILIVPIPLQLFFKKIIEVFIDSKSVHEYLTNSFVLGTFIEKSFIFKPNENDEFENDLKSDFLSLINFVINSMMNNNFFFVSSIHILGATIAKCPETAPLIIHSIWPRIIEYLTAFNSNDCIVFYQFEKKLNYESISSFSWIMHFLIDLNKSSFSFKNELFQYIEPIIIQLPSFLNPSLPKVVIRSVWMYINSLLDTAIKCIKNGDQSHSINQLKLFNELSKIVKNSVLLNYTDFFNTQNCDDNDESDFVISILGVISGSIFLILNNSNFLNDFSFFSEASEIQTIISLLLHAFDENTHNNSALESVTCCICIVLIQYQGVADQIREIINVDVMEKIIQSFSLMNDNVLKESIAAGIRALLTSNSECDEN